MVACGPPGLGGGKNILYHNNGDGTFSDVSEKSGVLKTPGTYGLGVLKTAGELWLDRKGIVKLPLFADTQDDRLPSAEARAAAAVAQL